MTAFCKDRPSVKKQICQYDLDWNQENTVNPEMFAIIKFSRIELKKTCLRR